MPVVRSKLDFSDVMDVLKAKGYGLHSDRAYAVRLNMASKTHKRKWDGAPRRDTPDCLLRGLSHQEVDTVLTNCETVEDAALMLERMSHGQVASALEETRPNPSGAAGLSAADLALIVRNQARSAADEQLAQVRSEVAELRGEMAEVLDELKKALVSQKKAAPKKKPKKGEVEKLSDDEVNKIVEGMNIPPEPKFDD